MFLAVEKNGKTEWQRISCKNCGNPSIKMARRADGSMKRINCQKCGWEEKSKRRRATLPQEIIDTIVDLLKKQQMNYMEVGAEASRLHNRPRPISYQTIQRYAKEFKIPPKFKRRDRKKGDKPAVCRHTKEIEIAKFTNREKTKKYATFKCNNCGRKIHRTLSIGKVNVQKYKRP